MVQDSKPSQGETISGGVWTSQLQAHIEYFDSNPDLREIKIVLPFGIPRERKPRDYEKKALKKIQTDNRMQKILNNPLGVFNYDSKAEIEEWKPRLKPMKHTKDQIQNKPTLLIIRHDPSEKKSMYLEQDLMAKPVSLDLDKKSGYSYRLMTDKNIVVRKFMAKVSTEKMLVMVKEFVTECNRILFMYCDTR